MRRLLPMLALAAATVVAAGCNEYHYYDLDVTFNTAAGQFAGINEVSTIQVLVMSVTGAVQVLASVDGTNFATVALALEDAGQATNGTYVLLTAPARIYKFWGKFTRLRVTQNGATATAASLLCGAGA